MSMVDDRFPNKRKLHRHDANIRRPGARLVSTAPLATDTGRELAAAGRSAGALGRIEVVNRFPAVEVFRAGSVLIGLVLAVYLLWRIEEILFLLFLAILLATAIEPLVG